MSRRDTSDWPLLIARALLFASLFGPLAALLLYAGSRRWFFPALVPQGWSLAPFWRQLSAPATREALGLSLLIAVTVTIFALLIGLPAARTLGLRRFRGRNAVLLIFFLPNIMPPVAIGLGLNILFLRLGLAGSIIGVIIVHLIPVLPYTIFALLGVFARYDEGYEQQARSLGAGPLAIWWRVILPLVAPGLAVAALFAFLVSWSQYVLTLLIGGGRVITLPILLFSTVSGGNPANIAIMALIFALPPLIAIALVGYQLSRDPLALVP